MNEENLTTEEKLEIAEAKLKEIEKLAKYYARICNGAGGQCLNIQDRQFGMAQVGKEILKIIKGK